MGGVKGKNNYQFYNEIVFKNETELEFYKKCESLVEKGRIKDFKFEEVYLLQDEFIDWRGNKIPKIQHTPDFQIYLNDGSMIIVDTKAAGAMMHDEVAAVKRKLWMFRHKNIPYYMISKTPKYLGGVWVETSKGNDFLTKLKNKYKKLYPNENTRKKDVKRLGLEEWIKYFEFENVHGLFYSLKHEYTKKELDKMEKEKLNV